MKKIFTIACLFAAFSASAQLLFRSEKTQFSGAFTSQSSLTDKPNIQYTQLSIGSTTSANDVETFTGVMDIGELKSWFLADTSGNKPLKFNSPMDVFNYLSGQGWEFVSAIEDTRSTALWAKLLFDVNTVRTRMTYIFKRQKK